MANFLWSLLHEIHEGFRESGEWIYGEDEIDPEYPSLNCYNFSDNYKDYDYKYTNNILNDSINSARKKEKNDNSQSKSKPNPSPQTPPAQTPPAQTPPAQTPPAQTPPEVPPKEKSRELIKEEELEWERQRLAGLQQQILQQQQYPPQYAPQQYSLPQMPQLPNIPTLIPYVPRIPMEQISLEYIARYCIYLLISSFLTQLPKLLGYGLLHGYTLIYNMFLAPAPRREYQYSKSYLYECSTRTYIRSSGNTSTITTADGIFGLRDIKNLLDYIVGLSFEKIEGLHRITYKYINIGSNSYKIPLILEPVKIEDNLFMFWKVLTRNDMPAEETQITSPQQEGYLKSILPAMGMTLNGGSGGNGVGGSSSSMIGGHRTDENKIVNIEQNNIEITLYSDAGKDRIELFEKELEDKRKKAIKALSNFQTVNFYNHRTMKGGRERKFVWDTYKFHTSKTFNNFFLPEKEKIMHVLQTFCTDKKKYCRLGKQDYLGILLYGLPGCGKTSLIKCIAAYTKRDVYVLKLSEIATDEELKSIFQNETLNIFSNIDGVCHGDYLCPFNGRILVIEDMDVDIQCIKDRDLKMQEDQEFLTQTNRLNKKIFEVIEGSKDINPETLKTLMTTLEGVKIDYKTDQLTNGNVGNRRFNLDIFLNILDGIQEQDGTILIMSTNYPKNIDKALVRPGRCDLQIKFEKSNIATLLEMMEYYHTDSPLLQEILRVGRTLRRIDRRFTASQFCQVLYEHSDSQFLDLLEHLDEEKVILGLLDHLNGELLERQPGMERQFSYNRLCDLVPEAPETPKETPKEASVEEAYVEEASVEEAYVEEASVEEAYEEDPTELDESLEEFSSTLISKEILDKKEGEKTNRKKRKKRDITDNGNG